MESFKTFFSESLGGKEPKIGVFTFGRFNPPTTGHRLLIDKLVEIGMKQGRRRDILVFPSRTHDPKKNPLDPRTKIRFMKRVFDNRQVKIIDDDKIKNPYIAAQWFNDNNYDQVIMVVGSDRVNEFKNGIGNFAMKQGFRYAGNFLVVSAGERDPDAEGVSGMSASKMRDAVKANDFKSFLNGIPNRDVNLGEDMFNVLKKALNIRESVEDYGFRSLHEHIDYAYVGEVIREVGNDVIVKVVSETLGFFEGQIIRDSKDNFITHRKTFNEI